MANRAPRRAAEPEGANTAADEGGGCRPRRARRSNIRLRGYAENSGESSESSDDDGDNDVGPAATQRPRKKRARRGAGNFVPPLDGGAARTARTSRTAEKIAPFVRDMMRHLRRPPAVDGRRHRAHACEVRRLCDGPDAPWVCCATQSEAAAMIGVTSPTVSVHLNRTHDTRVPGRGAIRGWLCRKPRADGDDDRSGEKGGDTPATAEESRRGGLTSHAGDGADNADSEEADANSALTTVP